MISGKEALIALANNEEVEYYDEDLGEWVYMSMSAHFGRKFRLKPKTITINGIEVPAPFKPKDGEIYYFINFEYEQGYSSWNCLGCDHGGAWRTEDDIKQVVAALRSIFNEGHSNSD